MTQPRLYLDHNATTPLRPAAAVAVQAALGATGNPSSVHFEGRLVRAMVEGAREQVARLVGATPSCVTFTSGATEALNLALSPDIAVPGLDRPIARLLMAGVEHPAILQGHRFDTETVTVLPVDGDGRLDLTALSVALADSAGTPMLALQSANNETGVLQPVAEAAALIHAQGGIVVVDAVQSAGRAACDIAELGADLLVLSGHKIGGPAGCGALVRRREAIHLSRPLVRGGGQERGLRAGTENILGIIGFGAAAQAAYEEREAESIRLDGLRRHLEAGLLAIDPSTVVFSAGAPRLPNTVAFAVPGIAAETALIALDLEGLAASSGSACSSGKVKASHVLDAMGVGPDLLHGMIRLSLGWTSTPAEVDAALAIWAKIHLRLAARAVAA